MDPAERLAEIRRQLILRSALNADGVHDRSIADEVRRGAWLRIARGVYASAAVHAEWSADERHLARATAAALTARARRPVFCGVTAAALLGIPSYNIGHERVHIALQRPSRVHSTRLIHRHETGLTAEEIVEVGGLLCTSPERTLVDVARFASTEQAVVVLDAGIRQLFAGDDNGPEEAWREEQLAALSRMPGERGAALARARLTFADQRSESVAESLSRLQLRRLGYAVELQVAVPSPSGAAYRVDFELLGRRTFGEVDGAAKYTDAALRGSRSAADVVLAEKRREDWIRGATGYGVVRWDFETSRSARALGERLRAFRVPPP